MYVTLSHGADLIEQGRAVSNKIHKILVSQQDRIAHAQSIRKRYAKLKSALSWGY